MFRVMVELFGLNIKKWRPIFNKKKGLKAFQSRDLCLIQLAPNSYLTATLKEVLKRGFFTRQKHLTLVGIQIESVPWA